MWAPSREIGRRAKKRSSNNYITIDVSAFASVMMAILFLFLARTINFHDLSTNAVDLPHAQYVQLEPGALREDAIIVVVTRDGNVFFGDSEISLEELSTLIHGSIRKGAERKVYLRGDARAKNGDVVAVAEKIRIAGITTISIMTASPR